MPRNGLSLCGAIEIFFGTITLGPVYLLRATVMPMKAKWEEL
jgi:hypothetical protein